MNCDCGHARTFSRHYFVGSDDDGAVSGSGEAYRVKRKSDWDVDLIDINSSRRCEICAHAMPLVLSMARTICKILCFWAR